MKTQNHKSSNSELGKSEYLILKTKVRATPRTVAFDALIVVESALLPEVQKLMLTTLSVGSYRRIKFYASIDVVCDLLGIECDFYARALISSAGMSENLYGGKFVQVKNIEKLKASLEKEPATYAESLLRDKLTFKVAASLQLGIAQ